MPWKMILVIVIIFLVGIFAGFNLNVTNISIGFYVFENVPVFLGLIISFIIGAGMMLPFTIRRKIKRKKKEKVAKKTNEVKQIEENVIENTTDTVDEKNKKDKKEKKNKKNKKTEKK